MNPKAEPIIRVENFTAAFEETVVLRNVSFEIERGEIFVILGGSGCGKSTLLKHMIGLYTPAEGRILIGGRDLASDRTPARESGGWFDGGSRAP